MDLKIFYDSNNLSFDLGTERGDLATDNGLLSAVLVSLFTDRRANADDVIPDGTGDRRGYWGDTYPEIDGDLIGSRLWLLSREKQLPDVLQRAQTYAEEALAWLVEDNIARSFAAPAEWVSPGVLGILLDILLTDGSKYSSVINYRLEV
jgi:phage gp46-like protein